MVRLLLTVVLCTVALVAPAPTTTPSADRAQAFERVYSEGRWLNGADGASACASGWSDVASGQGVAALRAVVSVVRTFNVRSVADVPCGDGCFAGALLSALRVNETEWTPSISYVGVDIVRSLVERNRARLGDSSTHFLEADVVSGADSIPAAELLFSRQMLQHMCNEDALRFIRLAARSSARFVMLTTFMTSDDFVNGDIPCASGGYRPQDLTKPPFSLPAPLLLFNEGYPVDSRVALGLWPVKTLRRRLL